MSKNRRLFPVLHVTVSGLDPTATCSFLLSFGVVGKPRWKSRNGRVCWKTSLIYRLSRCTDICLNSFQFKGDWGKKPVSQSKVRHTNHFHQAGTDYGNFFTSVNFQVTQSGIHSTALPSLCSQRDAISMYNCVHL